MTHNGILNGEWDAERDTAFYLNVKNDAILL